MDFINKDVQEHVNPHSFDTFFSHRQDRFDNYLNILYKRKHPFSKNDTRKDTIGSLLIYAGWFNKKNNINNAYRYNPSEISTKALSTVNREQLIAIFNLQKVPNLNKFSIIDINYRKTDSIVFLNKLIQLISEFNLNINNMDTGSILLFFTILSIVVALVPLLYK